MLHFKDRTFCNERCGNNNCSYRLSDEDRKNAADMALDISFAAMLDAEDCPGYMPPITEHGRS